MKTFFIDKIKSNFGFEMTDHQSEALSKIVEFLFSRDLDSIFLLKGYAGTGKSSLIGSLVRTMKEFDQKVVLLAPTGRAAKVFSKYANASALTIHRKIYRQKRFSNEPSGFVPVDNLHKDTLFIVDEASMIGNDGVDSFIFGSGRLLDDLVHYVYSGENCRLLLIGDSAQLPPVGQEYSPALQEEVLAGFGMTVESSILTQIVRQASDSGILYNATHIRNALNEGTTDAYPKLKVDGFSDIERISGEDLIDKLSTAYGRDGQEETIVVSRSNKRATAYNQGIRAQVFYKDEELSTGDMLMITKNNYFWVEEIEGVDFLANGELVEVLRVRKTQELYGFRFCDLLVKHADYEIEFEIKVLLDALYSETTSLSREKTEELFLAIMDDYEEYSTKSAKMKQLKKNPFFNAVQVKYGYAITCHKAQGGEWQNVFLDLGFVSEDHLGESFYRWFYTALTRASQKIYLVNFADDFFV